MVRDFVRNVVAGRWLLTDGEGVTDTGQGLNGACGAGAEDTGTGAQAGGLDAARGCVCARACLYVHCACRVCARGFVVCVQCACVLCACTCPPVPCAVCVRCVGVSVVVLV